MAHFNGGKAITMMLKRALLTCAVLLAVAQFIRPSKVNPPLDPALEIGAVEAVDPAVNAIFVRSCNDCHSYRTVWPWYSNFAPVSWLVAFDARHGREEMNFSEWGRINSEKRAKLLRKMCKEATEGEMPGFLYTSIHSQARLTSADVQTVCRWTEAAAQALPARNPAH